jgi:hypothetical protein
MTSFISADSFHLKADSLLPLVFHQQKRPSGSVVDLVHQVFHFSLLKIQKFSVTISLLPQQKKSISGKPL